MLTYTDKTRRVLDRAKNEQSMHSLLETYKLRATRQRLILAAHLFDGSNRLIDAESIYEDIALAGSDISLATVYNTLHRFAKVGMIRPVACHGQKQYYATDCRDSSFFHYENGDISAIENHMPDIRIMPTPPAGYSISHIDVAIHLIKKQVPQTE